MLTLPAWQGLNLTINFFSTKYMKHAAGCPNLPEQMKVRVCSMDYLPCYSGIDWDSFGHDDDVDDDDDAHDDGIEEEGSEELTCSQNSSTSEDGNGPLQPDFISPFLIRCNNVAEGEEDELTLVETNKLPETTVTVNQHPCLATDNRTREVEIIDICTPPIRSGNNKRRFSAVCPEIIIDLTESPILV
ncbi:unnamed protein product [Cuscuta campestris]|uniref:Uncharacterized protein n=1 Tax=Cuscuta campestris TaxID=132261 RepID=A0A484L3U7_9ASTE|nr:unnamed protein product [Cuscuta campestris]